jgi:UDPglucose 6-dehydrogenase
MIIGIAGLSHLGIVTAAGLAEKGFHIIAWDPDPIKLGCHRMGQTGILEPQLMELLAKNITNINFVKNPSEMKAAELVYIATDTPTNDKGSPDLSLIDTITNEVLKSLSNNGVLTILSQVPPGYTSKIQLPKERLFYQVETLIFGEAIKRFLAPERFIIGCDETSKQIHPILLKVLEKFQCPILTIGYSSAELAKISINSILASQVSTTNMLSALCESIGANWPDIIPALQLDKRIGKNAYLNPGLGLSGGNLERDLNVLDKLTTKHQIENTQIQAWLKTSNFQKDWLYRKLKSLVLDNHQNPKIAVLGIAYKENTDSTKNSSAIHFLNQIRGHNIYIHDPIVKLSKSPWLKQVENSDQAIENADVLILSTPWPEYQNLEMKKLYSLMKRPIIIDPLSFFTNQHPEQHGFQWARLGVGNSICL